MLSTIVADPASVSPDWLTEVLRDAGALSSRQSVATVTTGELGAGRLAHTVRLELTYRGRPRKAPRSLAAKFPAADAGTRSLAQALGMYAREVRFYQQLAPLVGMRVPHCYFAGVDAGEDSFALLLEDIVEPVVHGMVDPCPREDALLAVEQLALLHASHWNSPSLGSLGWLNQLVATAGLNEVADLVRLSWSDFTGPDSVRIDPELRKLGDRLCQAGLGNGIGGYQGPTTLIHGDFSLSNVLFITGCDGSRQAVTVDWQLTGNAAPLIDLAHLLGRMHTASRRSMERELVVAYHQGLQAAGVVDYPWETCWQDYQRWAWYAVVSAVLSTNLSAGGTAEEDQQRHADDVSRALIHALDHDSARFL